MIQWDGILSGIMQKCFKPTTNIRFSFFIGNYFSKNHFLVSLVNISKITWRHPLTGIIKHITKSRIDDTKGNKWYLRVVEKPEVMREGDQVLLDNGDIWWYEGNGITEPTCLSVNWIKFVGEVWSGLEMKLERGDYTVLSKYDRNRIRLTVKSWAKEIHWLNNEECGIGKPQIHQPFPRWSNYFFLF